MLRFLVSLVLLSHLLASAQLTDIDLIDRLQSVQNEVPLEYNDEVKKEILSYTSTVSSSTNKALSNFMVYDSAFLSIFEKYDVPAELRFASISLSDFRNNKASYQGRDGVFALTFRVAKKHGLNITNFIDERRNVTKAADAFCREMSSIYTDVLDWRKALIIYSSSDLDWQKARILSNDTLNDIWVINKYLKYEYSKVLPKFIASVYLGNYYREHGYSPAPNISDAQQVVIEKPITFHQIGKQLEIDTEKLRELNPTYRKSMVPQSAQTYTMLLPSDKIGRFYELGDTLYGLTITPEPVKVDLTETRIEEAPKPTPKPAKTHATLIYRVKSGDNLILIADIYDITVSSLKAQNGLRSSRINVNQRLYVKVPLSRKSYYMQMNRMSMAQKKAQARKD